MLIVLVKKNNLVLPCEKNIWIAVYSFSMFSVPTTVPAPTTTPEGKKEKTISKVAMMVMITII